MSIGWLLATQFGKNIKSGIQLNIENGLSKLPFTYGKDTKSEKRRNSPDEVP
jgi:hypothetical protein